MGYATRLVCRLPSPSATPPRPASRERAPAPPARRGDPRPQAPGRPLRQGPARRPAQEARPQARQGLRPQGPPPAAQPRPDRRGPRGALAPRLPRLRRPPGRDPRRPAVPGRDPAQAHTQAVQHPRRPVPPAPPPGAGTPSPANVRGPRRRRGPTGPDAQAAVVELNKQGGLSHGKVTRCLESLFEIRLSRGGSVHTVLRAASRCEPVYEAIRQTVAQSDWVVPDETGWRVGGYPVWLHTLVGSQATAYVIDST